MKKGKGLTAALVALCLSFGSTASVFAMEASNPTCVLMKFTDDTRYDLIESADVLSDLVMEKMVASGRFNLKETRPIDEDMEAQLYDERVQEFMALDAALETGDFNEVFEGPGFSEEKAQSIASACVGQIVTPAITAAIGRDHKAEYLIQGTVINLGTGNWWNSDFDQMSGAINMSTSMMGSSVAPNFLGGLGPLGSLLGGIDIATTGIGVQCDIRIIKADTGEVIWSKRVNGIERQRQVSVGFVSFGTTKLSANLYSKAMDKAAQAIVNAMLSDMDAKKLFLK